MDGLLSTGPTPSSLDEWLTMKLSFYNQLENKSIKVILQGEMFHMWHVTICHPHIEGSNADFAPHMEGSYVDFASHMERRHSFKDQKQLKLSFLSILKNMFFKPTI